MPATTESKTVRKAAKVSVPFEELFELLDLPSDFSVYNVYINHQDHSVNFLVESSRLPDRNKMDYIKELPFKLDTIKSGGKYYCKVTVQYEG